MSTLPPVGDAPNSPHAILLQSGCISANLSRAFQEWRDPYYASSASFAPPPATYVRKVSRLVVPAAPKPAAKPVDKVLGAYSLSSSDDEEELHPVPVKQPAPLAPSVVAQPGFDALISNGGDGVTQFEFCDGHTFFPLLT
jgi:hypothetical protein